MKSYLSRQSIAILVSLFLCACSAGSETVSIETVNPMELDFTQFYLDGVVYTMPCPYSDLAENGWLISPDQQTLGPNYQKAFDAEKDGSALGLRIENFTSHNAVPLEECYVMSVWQSSEFAYPLDGDGSATIVNAGNSLLIAGLRNGDSYDRMIELHGEPSFVRESKAYSHTAIYPHMEITYNPLDGQINLVSIQSCCRPDVTMETPELGSVPDYVQQYRQPEAFGEIADREIFQMEGDFYRMPIPLSWLEKNGLKLTDPEDGLSLNTKLEWNESVGAQAQREISMESKNGVPLQVTIKNYTDTPQEMQNCVVISIIGHDLDFELAGSVNESVRYEDIIELYGRANLRVDEEHFIVSYGNQSKDIQVRFFFSNSFFEPVTGFHIRYYDTCLPLE